MWTRCTACNFSFQVQYMAFNKPVKCPCCRAEFTATLNFDAPPQQIDIAQEISHEDSVKMKQQELKQQVLQRINVINEKINVLIPLIQNVAASKQNESTTKLIIDRVLQDILGYEISDITMEKDIQGKKADYVLSVLGKPTLVVEAKRVGLDLKDKQIIQATTYGAYSGIKWALLTNLQVWQLYYIRFIENKVEPSLIFSIDLRDGLDKQEMQYFYMFSKHGMENQAFLERLQKKVIALNRENVLGALLSDGVVGKIRDQLSQTAQCKLTDAEIRTAIETYFSAV